MQLDELAFSTDLLDVIDAPLRKSHSFDRLGIALVFQVLAFLDEFDLCGSIPLVSHQFHEIALTDDLWLAILQRILASWPGPVRDSFLTIERKLSSRKKVLLIKRSRCEFCGRQCTSKVALGKVGLDAIESLRLRICTKCQPKFLITKSFAKSHYLVTDKALDQLPAAQKSWYGKKCKLYFQPSVRQISMQRWKSEEILERERENRRPFDRSNPSLPPWKRLVKAKPHERTPAAMTGGMPAICNELNLYPTAAAPAMALDPYSSYQAPPQSAYTTPNQYLRLVPNALPPPSLILSHPGYGQPIPKGLPRPGSHEILWGAAEEDYWSSSEMFAD